MRANQVEPFQLPQEQITVPELGGDGVVTIRGVGFGRKIYLATEAPPGMAASMLAADAVLDDDGNQLMSAESWDAFAQLNEEAFLKILAAAKRVSGFDAGEVKKN